MIKPRLLLWVVVFSIGILFDCNILEAASVRNAHTEVDLISDIATIQPGRSFWVALRMKLDDHWHTYWENPGDSGMAAAIHWDLPEGFEAGPIQWPFPQRFDYPGGLVGYGYEGEVLLLNEIKTVKTLKANTSQSLKAQVRWLVCEKICVPGEASLSLELPVQDETPSLNTPLHPLFAKTISQWPIPEGESSWKLTVYEDKDFFYLHLLATKKDGYALTDVAFFPAQDDLINHAAEQILEKVEEGYELTLVKSSFLKEGKIQRLEGVLVSNEGWEGLGSRRALMVNTPIRERKEH